VSWEDGDWQDVGHGGQRAANHPDTTGSNYLLAAAQLGRYLAEEAPDFDAAEAADDLCQVSRGHVEAFQAWLLGGVLAHGGSGHEQTEAELGRVQGDELAVALGPPA
jgi:hypothetical protein